MTLFCIDIDGTIADPAFYDPDFETCVQRYINAGIATQEDVAGLRRKVHQHFYLLPHVLLTHRPFPGAVEALHALAQQGSLQYFTVRQALDPDTCRQVHDNTRTWLAQHGFPTPGAVHFFWDAGEKLLAALETSEDRIVLIDDRPEGLLEAHVRIAAEQPQRAQEVAARLVLVAFGMTKVAVAQPPQIPAAPAVIAFPAWSDLSELLSRLGKVFIDDVSLAIATKEDPHGHRSSTTTPF